MVRVSLGIIEALVDNAAGHDKRPWSIDTWCRGELLAFICLCDCDFCSVVMAEWSGGGSCNSGAVAAVAAVGVAATAAVVAIVADEWSTRSLGRQGSKPLLNFFTV